MRFFLYLPLQLGPIDIMLCIETMVTEIITYTEITRSILKIVIGIKPDPIIAMIALLIFIASAITEHV